MRVHTLRTGTAFLMAASLATLGGCSSKSSSKKTTTAPVASNTTSNTNGATVGHTAMSAPRGDHSATATPNGVVVIGGEANGAIERSVEVYQSGAWSPGGQLGVPRKGHSATLLRNGLILVAGGQSDVAGASLLMSTELYDPGSKTTRPAPALAQPRSGHVAVAFLDANGDEKVLIAGGVSGTGSVGSAELYDTKTNSITPISAQMVSDRVDARAIALSNGRILIQGGLTGFTPQNLNIRPAGAELFDPTVNAFTPTGALGIDRFNNALVRNDQGQILAIGGNSQARVENGMESYDPAKGSWSAPSAVTAVARENLTATTLGTGFEVLIAGGGNSSGVSGAVDLLDSTADAVSALQPLVVARRDHTATILPNGNVLIVGGFGQTGALTSAEEYDPRAINQTSVPAPTQPTTPSLPGTPIGTTPTTPTNPTPPVAPAPAPRILAILPTKGKPGDLITIAGQNFAKSKNDNQVFFGGGAKGKVLFEVKIKRLPVLGPVETLVVEVPNGAVTGDVVVISNNQVSPPKTFTIDLQSGGTPSVLYTLPRKAKVNGLVTVFGRNFARPANDNTVRFNGVQAQIIGGITTQSVPFLGNLAVMLVRVPAGAVTGDLTIDAYGKTSRGYAFTVEGTQPAPPATPSNPSTPSNPTNPTTPAPTTPSTPGNTVFYSEDFEGATVAMTRQGNLFEASRPVAGQGPGRAASGQWCIGTAMTAGAYAANDNGYIFTRAIDLTNAQAAELTFNQFFDTDGADAGRVIVSPNGGQDFYLAPPAGGYLAASVFNPAQGFTGNSQTWLRTRVDLTAFVGNPQVIIGFEFKANGADQRSGWFLDDLKVEGN